MANELESSNNEEIEAVAEEQVELDEFKASGENSAVADPVVKGSNSLVLDHCVSPLAGTATSVVVVFPPSSQPVCEVCVTLVVVVNPV